jgi:hypothetical protein
MLLHQSFHAGGGFGGDRIEQASPFEKPGPGLMLEAILQIPVVVLVRLGVHEDRVVDLRLPHELRVVFQRLWLGLVGRVRVNRKSCGVLGEQMNVRVHQDPRRPGALNQRRCCRSQHPLPSRHVRHWMAASFCSFSIIGLRPARRLARVSRPRPGWPARGAGACLQAFAAGCSSRGCAGARSVQAEL